MNARENGRQTMAIARPANSARCRRSVRLTAALGLAVAAMLAMSAASWAGPVWRLDSIANSSVAPGGSLTYHVQMQNVGDAVADTTQPGRAAQLTGTLPAGISLVSASGSGFDCSASTASALSCTNDTDPIQTTADAGFYNPRLVTVQTTVSAGASGELRARFQLSGGGAATVTTVDPTLVTAAAPVFGIDAFDGQDVSDAAGTPSTQAGAHPYAITTTIDFDTTTHPNPVVGDLFPVAPPKDIFVDLPPGLLGSVGGMAQCTAGDLANTVVIDPRPLCPPASQIGTTIVRARGIAVQSFPTPVFNMVPPPGMPARFGFNIAGALVTLDLNVRSATDYGARVTVHDLSEGLAIAGTSLTIWGVPADSSHDAERACPGQEMPGNGGPTCAAGVTPRPFLRNPTSCTPDGVGLPTTLQADSWEDPGAFVQSTFFSHQPPGYPFLTSDWGPQQGITGCDRVPFSPGITARPASSLAGGPSGFSVDLTIPQSDNPDAIAQSDLKKAVVTLPAGVHVNPSSADGLAACAPSQIALHDTAEPTCPDASKLGTVTIDTPLLNEPLQGAVYLATPFDNPFGTLMALYIVAEGPGVVVKLAGRVDTDPQTGQVTTTFDDNPQTPFSKLHLELKSGPRAPLALPDQCGRYTTEAQLTGWNGRTVTSEDSFTMSQNAKGQPCPPQFSPGFSAGTASNSAGSSSSFLLRITRADEDQQLSGLTVHMPSGLTGRIANAVLCAEGDAAAGTCPDGSKVGDVTVGAGAGANPFFITNGRAYITGPYKGAPFGLSIVVPAVAGPFDLGNVNVRAAIFVDKHDATLSVVSDPLPTILQGIPLDVRDVRVSIDKPNFIVNPTSCAVKSIGGAITSTAGVTANVSDRFQAADCASLGFKPRMVLTVGGKHHTHAGEPSPLTTRITMPNGSANLRFVRVSLPTTINARLTVINDACTRAEFESDIAKCAHAKAGTAVAVTPLLRDPLRGNVYFVRNGHPIPDLFVALRGQVSFDLIGRITIPGGKRLATTFSTPPDVPIRSFTLRLLGDSKNGSIGAATNLCTAKARKATAALDFIGQNGKVSQVDQRLVIHGCPKKRKAVRHRRH